MLNDGLQFYESLRVYFVGKGRCSETVECWELNTEGGCVLGRRGITPCRQGSESGTGPGGLRHFWSACSQESQVCWWEGGKDSHVRPDLLFSASVCISWDADIPRWLIRYLEVGRV